MEVSIIIVNYNMRGLVKNCLKSVLESQFSLPYEIIVVDNNSGDQVEEMLKEKFKTVKLIKAASNKGMGAGANLGLREAGGKYVLILNPDIHLFPNSLQTMYDYIKDKPEVGILAPQLLNANRTVQSSCYRWHSFWTPIFRRSSLKLLPFGKRDLSRFLMEDFAHNETREVPWIQGSCWLLPRRILLEIGFFDERFFMYFEDTDFCRRVKQAGFKNIYHAEAQVIHLHRRASADGGLFNFLFNKLTRAHIVSWIKYMIKWRKSKF